MAAQKKAESSSSSPVDEKKVEKVKQESATAPAGVSEVLQGPTTADLNPAYNAPVDGEEKSDKKS